MKIRTEIWTSQITEFKVLFGHSIQWFEKNSCHSYSCPEKVEALVLSSVTRLQSWLLGNKRLENAHFSVVEFPSVSRLCCHC